MRHGIRESLFAVFLLLLSLLAYWPALDVFFSLDDALFLMAADGQADWPAGTRRLLSVRLFFDSCWRSFGENPAPFHVLILLMHGASAWLLGRVGRLLGLSAAAAAVAALFFLASPVAFTCLHWISGVQDVMMAFFALLAAFFWLRGGWTGGLVALVFAMAAVLSKEASVLLLPTLALLLPGERRRRILIGGAALLLGALLLYTGGAFAQKSAGDPYATVYGANLLWNLLTYTAWLPRLWDVFPDQAPQFQPLLWRWGLLLPLLLLAAALWKRHWAPAIGKAALLFIVLLLPVLPLVRHSYLYYLYLPAAPLWLLAAAGADRLPARPRKAMLVLPLVLLALTLWRGEARRNLLLPGDLLADPVLRYGGILESTVATLREQKPGLRGDMLVLTPFGQHAAVNLAEGLRADGTARRVQFLPVTRATYQGKALRLFFPGLKGFAILPDLPGHEVPVQPPWEEAELFLLGGVTTFTYLGRGEAGRHALSRHFFQNRDLLRARREIEALLQRQPTNPDLLYDVGAIALAGKDLASLGEVWGRLQAQAAAEDPPGRAQAARRALELSLERAGVDPANLITQP